MKNIDFPGDITPVVITNNNSGGVLGDGTKHDTYGSNFCVAKGLMTYYTVV